MGIDIVRVGGNGAAFSSGTGASIRSPEPAQAVSRMVTVKDAAVDNEAVKKMVEEILGDIGSKDITMRFSTYGKNRERIAIAITDRETGRVIREIPSEEIQSLIIKMNELAGIICNNLA